MRVEKCLFHRSGSTILPVSSWVVRTFQLLQKGICEERMIISAMAFTPCSGEKNT